MDGPKLSDIKYKYKEFESAGTGTSILLQNQITEVHAQGTWLASVVLTLLAPSTLSVLSWYVWVEGGSNF